MDSLVRVENAPPAQRSTIVGQAGVLSDLLLLPKDQAIAWLQTNLHSPISRNWGILLRELDADWATLKKWLHLSKEHALAALDAIESHIQLFETLPSGSNRDELMSELQTISDRYQTPRVTTSFDVVRAFVNQNNCRPLSAELLEASIILFGKSDDKLPFYLKDRKSKLSQWDELFHRSDRKRCVVVLDWKTTEADQQMEISTLPIVRAQSTTNAIDKSSLLVETVDFGNDEIIFVVLPKVEMQRLKLLAPAEVRFTANP